jgi:hypothetical protein
MLAGMGDEKGDRRSSGPRLGSFIASLEPAGPEGPARAGRPAPQVPRREALLRAAVVAGAGAVVLTELLSWFHLLRRVPLVLGWCAILVAIAKLVPRPKLLWKFAGIDTVIWPACAVIAGVVGFTALVSPPNSADAMAYHLPRVVYWAQTGSVTFFPTPYFNQVMLQPMAEYLMLHTYLITGGDHLVNLVAWAAFAGCVIGVSAIGAAMGLGTRGQALAALVCATLPNAILQGSGAKNDLLLAFWLVCTVYFLAKGRAVWFGLAVGLALATKATGYLFVAPLLVWVAVRRDRRAAVCAVAGTLLINMPQYVRNLRLSGSPLGYDSAQGNGYFRWRNEYFGWQPLVSNALRNVSEQLGARSPRWSEWVFETVVRAHQAVGLDPNDPATTWRGASFAPPVNSNHEANANNRWHLLLYAAAGLLALGDRRWRWYAAGLLGAFLLFCFYLKWQPFLARLEAPLFVAAAPLGAWLLERVRPTWVALLAGLFLVNAARPALFENWTRPMKGAHSLFTKSRDENYFNDMGQWGNRASYVEAVDRVARSGCERVGLDISENQLEYPFQALLKGHVPGVRFVHTGAAFPPGSDVCAVLCLDCFGNQQKIELYREVGAPVEIGRFLLFMR